MPDTNTITPKPSFDLATSEGGRGYLADLFKTQLKRSDFAQYIQTELAADFACVLSRYLRPILESAEADEAQELARCRAAWEADRSMVFADYWNGWKASTLGRADQWVSVEAFNRVSTQLEQSTAAHEVAAQNHGALNTEVFVLQRRVDLLEVLLRDIRSGRSSLAVTFFDRIDAALNPPDGKTAPYDRRSDLACYFGLSYASWLTLPRVLMEAMPDDWKKGMARLLHQYSETYTNQPDYGTTVRVTTVRGQLIETPDWMINYRHPNHEMINQLRGPKAAAQVDEAEQRKQDDESLQRRHDDERREYFSDGE